MTFSLVGIRNIEGGRFAVFQSYPGALYAMPWERYSFLGKPRTLDVECAG